MISNVYVNTCVYIYNKIINIKFQPFKLFLSIELSTYKIFIFFLSIFLLSDYVDKEDSPKIHQNATGI